MDFDPNTARARSTDPDTSHEAAEDVDVNKLQATICALLDGFPGGLTWSEISVFGEIDRQSVSPRLVELRNKGLIEDSGERRKSYWAKCHQIVWRKT